MLLRLLLLLIVLLIKAQSAEAVPKPVEIPRTQIIALENSVTGGALRTLCEAARELCF